jgi:hypothetical protein
MILFEKEPRQTIGSDVGGNPFRIEAQTGGLNSLGIQIRRKYLYLASFRRALEAFVEEDTQRIGFLTARTARDPHADVLVIAFGGKECRHSLVRERFKGLGVPKKTGHTNEQFFEQEVEFLGMLLYESDVLLRLLTLVDTHPSCNTPRERERFVAGKIVTGTLLKEKQDLREHVDQSDTDSARVPGCAILGHRRATARHVRRQQDIIDETSSQGAAGIRRTSPTARSVP